MVDAATGGQHTLLLDEDGGVWVCCWNEFSQLGIGESLPSTPILLKNYILDELGSTDNCAPILMARIR